MMSGLSGKWQLETSDNFEGYMAELGVSWMIRKIAGKLKPRIEIKNDGEKWNVDSYSTFRNSHVEFTLGKEFDEDTPDGRKYKTTVVLDGDKLVMTQIGAVNSTVIRELVDPDTQLVTFKAGNAVCKRTYKREIEA